MSLRQPVNRERIADFLRKVGELYHQPARLYLVGGTSLVLEDVVTLLVNHRIVWDRLETMYHEILPLMGQKSLRQKPGEFARNFQALAALWHSAGGTL